jgi:hypothetical protein
MTMTPNPIGNPSDPDSAEQTPPADGGAPPVGAGDHGAGRVRAHGRGRPG